MKLGDAINRLADQAFERTDDDTGNLLLSLEAERVSGRMRSDLAHLALDGAVARLRVWQGNACAERQPHAEHTWTELVGEEAVDRWCRGWTTKLRLSGEEALVDDSPFVSSDSVSRYPFPGEDLA